MITGILFVCLTSGKLAAQRSILRRGYRRECPYTKGEVKQELRFINSLGFKNIQNRSYNACKKISRKSSLHIGELFNNDSFYKVLR